MTAVDFGIAAMASVLGEPHDVMEEARARGVKPQVVAAMGFRTFHRAPPGATITMFGVAAAKAALDKAALDVSQIDYLVVASSNVPEYLQWDLSTAVARGLGLRDTPTLSLTQGCLAAVQAFEYIAGLFAIRDELQTVLLVSAEVVCEEHVDRLGNGTNADSDGAVAVVLRRGHPSLRWLASEQLTDPAYADFFRLEYGGGMAPFPPPGRSNRDVDPARAIFDFFNGDAQPFAEYVRMTDARIAEAVDGACKRAGVQRADLTRAILLHTNQVTLRRVADVLGIAADQTNAALAANLGHFGGLDPLVCLDIQTDRGEFAPGDLLALAGMSSGLHWFCTLIRV